MIIDGVSTWSVFTGEGLGRALPSPTCCLGDGCCYIMGLCYRKTGCVSGAYGYPGCVGGFGAGAIGS